MYPSHPWFFCICDNLIYLATLLLILLFEKFTFCLQCNKFHITNSPDTYGLISSKFILVTCYWMNSNETFNMSLQR